MNKVTFLLSYINYKKDFVNTVTSAPLHMETQNYNHQEEKMINKPKLLKFQ